MLVEVWSPPPRRRGANGQFGFGVVSGHSWFQLRQLADMTGMACPILPAYRAHLLTLLLLVAWAIATLTWWVLAFPPLVDTPPAWLARLQQVCFGTDASGSPALYGWGA